MRCDMLSGGLRSKSATEHTRAGSDTTHEKRRLIALLALLNLLLLGKLPSRNDGGAQSLRVLPARLREVRIRLVRVFNERLSRLQISSSYPAY